MRNYFYAHSNVFWCLVPFLLHNLEYKNQNNTLVSDETVAHLGTYIILYTTFLIP